MRPSLLLFSLSLSLSLYAQSPYLVKDINTTAGNPVSSTPHDFAALGNRTFFAARTLSAGDEVWVTDGTSAGTSLVADIRPGEPDSGPSGLVALNGAVLFVANDGVHGSELWRSDGTAAGTSLVLDINPTTGSVPRGDVILNNRLYFNADDGTHGQELWSSDGTAAGTRMVKDLAPGAASLSPYALTVFNGSIYFAASNSFWKTDGTDAGTVKIADVQPFNITVLGARLYMRGFTSEAGAEPWISDGTAAGTRMIADVAPGTASSISSSTGPEFALLGNNLLFVATDGVHGREMWVTDGTAPGTRMIRDFVPGAQGVFDGNAVLSYLTVFNGRAFFAARDPDHGVELWTTDGTDAGTALFADLAPGLPFGAPGDLLVVNGRLFFLANGPSSFATAFLISRPLWVSDGTVAGTHMVGGVDGPGVATAPGFRRFWPTGGKLYFAGMDLLNGAEPWVTTDGGDAHPIANLNTDPAASSRPDSFTAADNLLFFYARERGTDYSLWRSDGTAAGTFKLLERDQDHDPLMPAGPVILFDYSPGDIVQRFVSDGTVAGTQSAQFYMNRFGGGRMLSAFTIGTTLFANIDHDHAPGSGLWAASTAPSGPAINVDSHGASSMIDFSGRLAFFGGNGYELRTSDGTPGGTYTFASLPFATEHSEIVNAAGTLYFLKVVASDKRQLWKSDGTADGTTMVVEPVTQGISHTSTIVASGRKVYFVTGGSLWVSDGTPAGTVELVPYAFSTGEAQPFKNAGSHLVWTNWTQFGGAILWTSDGTKDGTKQLMTLDPGIVPLTEIDGTVFFAHADADHGSELWTTDGTAEGTKLYLDLNPGPAGSFPKELTKIGNLLYVSATTAATGAELWAIPLTEPTISIGDARVSEGGSAAHLAVSLNIAAAQTVTLSYATSDGTAIAGQDYDATSGTITFAAGETSKTIDVAVRGDAASENNETFFVTLSGVKGARVIRGEAVAVIDDDDQFADLGVAPKFAPYGSFGLSDSSVILNNGPRSATDVKVTMTSTPASTRTCTVCTIQRIDGGATAETERSFLWPGYQTYVSANVTARQRDLQTSNNGAAWTVSGDGHMAMDAPYLRVGQTAWLTVAPNGPVSLVSSDPSVLSVPPALTLVNNSTHGVARVTANKAGTANITFTSPQQHPLQITVLDAGAQMRWPGGVTIEPDFTEASFGRLNVSIAATGTAPFTGAKATGTVVVTAAGQELGRQQVNGNSFVMPVYLPKLGTMPYTVSYSGDSNFLPQTVSRNITVFTGPVTITGALERTATAGTYLLKVLVTGSPVSAPTGTLSVRNGGTEIAQIPLVASSGGTSIAQTTLTNLPPSATLTVNYPGDSFYASATQQIRVVESHQRPVQH